MRSYDTKDWIILQNERRTSNENTFINQINFVFHLNTFFFVLSFALLVRYERIAVKSNHEL